MIISAGILGLTVAAPPVGDGAFLGFPGVYVIERVQVIEREVVKEERRQRYENQPYGTILLEALDRAYTTHPYKWPTIGWMEDIKGFFNRYYTPNNASLVIAGDVSATVVRTNWDLTHFPTGRCTPSFSDVITKYNVAPSIRPPFDRA